VGSKRIDERRRGIGHQHHVRLVDALPAGDGRAIEHLAVLEGIGIQRMRREADVVLDAAHVGEAQVDEFDVFGLDGFEDFIGGHGAARAWTDDGKVQAACQPL